MSDDDLRQSYDDAVLLAELAIALLAKEGLRTTLSPESEDASHMHCL